MSNQLRFVILAGAAVVVFATGLLLTRNGRPYSTALITVHKLIDVAGIALAAVIVIGALRAGESSGFDWALAASALVIVLATLVTGGVVSASERVASWVTVAHRVLPWPFLLLLGLAVHRFASRG